MADGTPTPTSSTVSISIDFVLAFLTGKFGASVDSHAARFDMIERLASVLRAALLTSGPLGTLHELAGRLGVRLARIGALPSEYCDERGRQLGGCWWLGVVGGEIVAVSTVGDDNDEAEGIHVDALANAIGAKLLTMLGVPAERAVQNDLLEVRHSLILAMMVPREALEVLDDDDEEAERLGRTLNVPGSMVYLRAERLRDRMSRASDSRAFEVAA